MYHKFLILSRGKQIALIVCAVHLLAVFGLLGHHFISKKFRPPRTMIVRTTRVAEAQHIPVAKVETPKKQAAVAPKIAKKSVPTPKPTVANKPVVHHPPKEIVSRLETKPARPELQLPKTPLPSHSIAAAPSPTYGEFLVAYLQSALDLPEYGEVRVSLEIDRFGKFVDCKILEAKSGKNAEFLKNQLPDLTFPCLNDFDILDTSQTFTITFRNIETH